MDVKIEGFVKRSGTYPAKDGRPETHYVRLGGMDDVMMLLPVPFAGADEGDYVALIGTAVVRYLGSDRALVLQASVPPVVKILRKKGE